MARIARITPWLLAAGAVAFAIAVLSVDIGHVGELRIAAVVTGLLGCVVAFASRRLPWWVVVGTTLPGLHVIGHDVGPVVGQPGAIDRTTVIVNVVVGIAILTILAYFLRRRGPLDHRDGIDVLTVTLSTALAAWVIVGSPLIYELHNSPALSLAAAAYIPTSALVFAFVVDLAITGPRSNRTAQIVTISAAANLAAAVMNGLHTTGTDLLDGRVHLALSGAAYLLLCAGFSHADTTLVLESEGSGRAPAAYTPFRLALTGVCLILPSLFMALFPAISTVDTVARAALIVALVCAVLARLFTAVRSDEHAKRELLDRLHVDELTGLPTRARFVEVVADVLETTWRSERQPTVIQLNLDRFKNINDSLGHYEANQVLVAVGERLAEVTAHFRGTLARSGGDDFVILITDTHSTAEATERLDAVQAALEAPISIGDASVFVTASYGVAVAPRNRTVTAEEFMRRAHIATHSAKANGHNSVTFYDESMQARVAHRMDVEHALHGAIGRHEMQLYYQPIIDTSSGTVSGFEALMRWLRADGTLVSPVDFIPIAEETGIINELGAWALEESLRELRGWINDGITAPTTTVSVNVSPRQVADANFAATVRQALDATGMPAHLLWLEMTESMMLDEPDLAQRTLREIRSMGVRLALDDFGTGFSSLSLLQQFPMQRIKIDQAFVSGIDQSNDRSLVRTIVAMAQSMGLDLVAEGVETVHQLQALRDLSCDKAQGYLISRPVPADAMRSTMVALQELTSMPLFMPRADISAVGVGPATAQPSAPEHSSLNDPLPSISSRPLGQPVV